MSDTRSQNRRPHRLQRLHRQAGSGAAEPKAEARGGPWAQCEVVTGGWENWDCKLELVQDEALKG